MHLWGRFLLASRLVVWCFWPLWVFPFWTFGIECANWVVLDLWSAWICPVLPLQKLGLQIDRFEVLSVLLTVLLALCLCACPALLFLALLECIPLGFCFERVWTQKRTLLLLPFVKYLDRKWFFPTGLSEILFCPLFGVSLLSKVISLLPCAHFLDFDNLIIEEDLPRWVFLPPPLLDVALRWWLEPLGLCSCWPLQDWPLSWGVDRKGCWSCQVRGFDCVWTSKKFSILFSPEVAFLASSSMWSPKRNPFSRPCSSLCLCALTFSLAFASLLLSALRACLCLWKVTAPLAWPIKASVFSRFIFIWSISSNAFGLLKASSTWSRTGVRGPVISLIFRSR